MTLERRVNLFKNGCSPELRIPRELKLPGAEAILRNDDAPLILEQAPSKSLLAVLSRLSPIEEDFEPIADPPP
jgi:antitoxin VapB